MGEYIEQKLTPILPKKDTNVTALTEDIEVSIIEVPTDSTYTIEYQLAPVHKDPMVIIDDFLISL